MIDPDKLHEIFMDCMFHADEVVDGKPNLPPLIITGIMNNFGLHPERFKQYEDQIIEWLNDLPKQFKKSGGGGWSFLNACVTKDKDQWTGLHVRMEQLFVLGIAIKKVKYLMPKDMWSILPGGMPYLIIDM